MFGKKKMLAVFIVVIMVGMAYTSAVYAETREKNEKNMPETAEREQAIPMMHPSLFLHDEESREKNEKKMSEPQVVEREWMLPTKHHPFIL
ncbi:MAG TPA: hypothetical protein ENG06_01545, partial [Thermoplasmatales archaeon]|nr:hypothetical protein [Thermoplasmatales archaeon]